MSTSISPTPLKIRGYLNQIGHQLLDTDTPLLPKRPLPVELQQLERLNETLKAHKQSHLDRSRALYADVAQSDLQSGMGKQLLTTLKRDLTQQLQALDETSVLDSKSLRSFMANEAGLVALELEARLNVQDYLLQREEARLANTPGLKPHDFFASHNVPYFTWTNLVSAKTGVLTALGRERLNPGGYKRLTDALFLEWVGRNDLTELSANGFRDLHRIKPAVWAANFKANGEATTLGLERLSKIRQKPMKITDALLLEWKQLSSQPAYQNKAAVEAFARRHNLHPPSWRAMVNNQGAFRVNRNTIHRVTRLGLAPPGPMPAS